MLEFDGGVNKIIVQYLDGGSMEWRASNSNHINKHISGAHDNL